MSTPAPVPPTGADDQPTEAVILDTDRGQVVVLHNEDVMRDLRNNHPDFTEGAMVVVTYPSHVRAYFSYDNPKMLGVEAFVGDAIVKDFAGNWQVERAIPAGLTAPERRG